MCLIVAVIAVGLYAILFTGKDLLYQRVRYNYLDCPANYRVKFTRGISYIYDPPGKDIDTVILFSHGTGTNITTRDYIRNFCRRYGLGLFLYDYYGYGCSENVDKLMLNETHLYASIEVAYDEVRRLAPGKKIVGIGESLGCHPTCWLAANYPVDRIILTVPFDCLSNVIGLGASVVGLLDNRPLAERISVPTLIIAGKYDELIGEVSTRRLYNSLGSKKKYLYFANTGHNDYFCPEVETRMANFALGKNKNTTGLKK